MDTYGSIQRSSQGMHFVSSGDLGTHLQPAPSSDTALLNEVCTVCITIPAHSPLTLVLPTRRQFSSSS